MSIEMARSFFGSWSPSWSKKRSSVAAPVAFAGPDDGAVCVVGDQGQVALAAPVADLVDADQVQLAQPAVVEFVGDDAADDRGDRSPADAEQPADHAEGRPLSE